MKHSFLASACAVSLTLSFAAQADTVRLAGASTVFNVVVSPGKDAVEKATGHTLLVASSNTGRGLVDVLEGKADVAMVSEPMNIAAEAAAAAGKAVDIKAMQVFEVRKDEIVFVVHPSNPVGKLSWEQIRDIHTGKISNWKELGGKDLPIVVYADAVTGGTRAMIHQIVMGGAAFGAGVKSQTSVKRAAELVAGDEAGVAGVGRGFVEAGKQKVLESKRLERPLTLVTLGAPKPAQKAVIDAFIAGAKP